MTDSNPFLVVAIGDLPIYQAGASTIKSLL